MQAAIGRAGISPHKVEGDGATPAGRLPLLRLLYRADRVARPRTPLPVEPIAAQDGWCDDPDHRAYNMQVQLPFEARHEVLWRDDGPYDLIGVLGWNVSPVLRGRGSAVFLHVARADLSPTEGCVALALPDLLALLGDGLRGIEISG